MDIGNGELTLLAREGGHAQFVSEGYIVYGTVGGALLAARFDPATRRMIGEPAVVLNDVSVVARASGVATHFTVSDDGTAVYLQGAFAALSAEIVITDLRTAEEVKHADASLSPRFSPSGGRLAFHAGRTDALVGPLHVYVLELDLGLTSQLTFEGVNLFPIWSPDGEYVAFTSRREGTDSFDVHRIRSNGRGGVERLTTAPLAQGPRVWLPDGRMLISSQQAESQYDLQIMDSAGQVTPFLNNPWNETAASISPDGRWVAYVSDEKGQDEVYVTTFPDAGGRWQVSLDGGSDACGTKSGPSITCTTPIFTLRKSGRLLRSQSRVIGWFCPARLCLAGLRRTSIGNAEEDDSLWFAGRRPTLRRT